MAVDLLLADVDLELLGHLVHDEEGLELFLRLFLAAGPELFHVLLDLLAAQAPRQQVDVLPLQDTAGLPGHDIDRQIELRVVEQEPVNLLAHLVAHLGFDSLLQIVANPLAQLIHVLYVESLQEVLVHLGGLEILDLLDVDLELDLPALVLLAEERLRDLDGRRLLVADDSADQQLVELLDGNRPDEPVRPDVNLGVVQLGFGLGDLGCLCFFLRRRPLGLGGLPGLLFLRQLDFQPDVGDELVFPLDGSALARRPDAGPAPQLLDLAVDLLVGHFELGSCYGDALQRRQLEFRPDLDLELERHRARLGQLDLLVIDIRVRQDVQLPVLDRGLAGLGQDFELDALAGFFAEPLLQQPAGGPALAEARQQRLPTQLPVLLVDHLLDGLFRDLDNHLLPARAGFFDRYRVLRSPRLLGFLGAFLLPGGRCFLFLFRHCGAPNNHRLCLFLTDFCKMEVRLILFKEIGSAISLNNSSTDYLSGAYRFGKKNRKADFSFLKVSLISILQKSSKTKKASGEHFP